VSWPRSIYRGSDEAGVPNTEDARLLAEPLGSYLARLRAAGLRSLPGTAAEILDDPIRAELCPDKRQPDVLGQYLRSYHRRLDDVYQAMMEPDSAWMGLREVYCRGADDSWSGRPFHGSVSSCWTSGASDSPVMPRGSPCCVSRQAYRSPTSISTE
jgi:hypothetical protein